MRGAVDGVDQEVRQRLIGRINGDKRAAILGIRLEFLQRAGVVIGNTIHAK
jgi:hypothetical protein